MTLNSLDRLHHPSVSRSRLRHVETRLEADAEAILREIAFVLAMTQRVKREILSERAEPAATV